MPKRIIVSGGGIGGLSFAASARRLGFEVTVFERSSDVLRANAGGGLGLWPPAVSALDLIGARPALESASSLMSPRGYCDSTGRSLGQPSPHFAERYPVLCLQRAELLSVLLDRCRALGVTITSGCGVDSYTVDADDPLAPVRVTLSGDAAGSAAAHTEADILVAADGINSVIRDQMLAPAPRDGPYHLGGRVAAVAGSSSKKVEPVPCGYAYFRATLPFEDAKAHAMTFEAWGDGRRFGYVPLRYPEVFWFGVVPYGTEDLQESIAGAQVCRSDDVKPWLLKQFGHWRAPGSVVDGPTFDYTDLITRTDEILRTDIRKVPNVTSFPWAGHGGRVVLLGDACHAVAPNLAQGAGLSIEDGAELAFQLGRAAASANRSERVGSQGWADARSAAAAAYETERKHRALVVQSLADLVAVTGQATGTAARCRDAVMGAAAEYVPTVQQKAFDTVVSFSLGGHAGTLHWRPPLAATAASTGDGLGVKNLLKDAESDPVLRVPDGFEQLCLLRRVLGPAAFSQLPDHVRRFRALSSAAHCEGTGTVSVSRDAGHRDEWVRCGRHCRSHRRVRRWRSPGAAARGGIVLLLHGLRPGRGISRHGAPAALRRRRWPSSAPARGGCGSRDYFRLRCRLRYGLGSREDCHRAMSLPPSGSAAHSDSSPLVNVIARAANLPAECTDAPFEATVMPVAAMQPSFLAQAVDRVRTQLERVGIMKKSTRGVSASAVWSRRFGGRWFRTTHSVTRSVVFSRGTDAPHGEVLLEGCGGPLDRLLAFGYAVSLDAPKPATAGTAAASNSNAGALQYRSVGMWVLGRFRVPLPQALLPSSRWSEVATADGWTFDGTISLPSALGGAALMRYNGTFAPRATSSVADGASAPKAEGSVVVASKRRVLLTGGTGLIGTAACRAFADAGWEVVVLSRDPAPVVTPPGASRMVWWDGKTTKGGWATLITDQTVVVNLAGSNPGAQRWGAKTMQAIEQSRVDSITAVAAGIKQQAAAGVKPVAWLQASAVGVHGHKLPPRGEAATMSHGDNGPFLEDAVVARVDSRWPHGTRFRAMCCQSLEATAREEAEAAGVPLTVLRYGLVMARDGGFFPPLRLAARCGVKAIGDGTQVLPWIHVEDAALVTERFATEAFTVASSSDLSQQKGGAVKEANSVRCTAVNVVVPGALTTCEEMVAATRGHCAAPCVPAGLCRVPLPGAAFCRTVGPAAVVFTDHLPCDSPAIRERGIALKYADIDAAVNASM